MNPLEFIKKGISAMKPAGKTAPVKPPPTKLLGPKGVPTRDVAEQAKKRNQTVKDMADELEKP